MASANLQLCIPRVLNLGPQEASKDFELPDIEYKTAFACAGICCFGKSGPELIQRFSKASFHCFRRNVRRVSFIDEIY